MLAALKQPSSSEQLKSHLHIGNYWIFGFRNKMTDRHLFKITVYTPLHSECGFILDRVTADVIKIKSCRTGAVVVVQGQNVCLVHSRPGFDTRHLISFWNCMTNSWAQNQKYTVDFIPWKNYGSFNYISNTKISICINMFLYRICV